MRKKRLLRQSISAAKIALEKLESGSPISVETLKQMSRAIGEPLDQYDNIKNGLFPQTESQIEEAKQYLKDFIHDRNIELRSK